MSSLYLYSIGQRRGKIQTTNVLPGSGGRALFRSSCLNPMCCGPQTVTIQFHHSCKDRSIVHRVRFHTGRSDIHIYLFFFCNVYEGPSRTRVFLKKRAEESFNERTDRLGLGLDFPMKEMNNKKKHADVYLLLILSTLQFSYGDLALLDDVDHGTPTTRRITVHTVE